MIQYLYLILVKQNNFKIWLVYSYYQMKLVLLMVCNIHRMEYPITELVYGIENNINEKIEFGKKIILKKCESDEDIIKIMK